MGIGMGGWFGFFFFLMVVKCTQNLPPFPSIFFFWLCWIFFVARTLIVA